MQLDVNKLDACVSMMLASSNARDADVILVQPPFASPDRPSLALHILQGIARAQGRQVCVIYANLSFANLIGPRLYRHLCHTPTEELVGERVFRLAWHVSAKHGYGTAPKCWNNLEIGTPDFHHLQHVAAKWAECVADALASTKSSVLGFSTSFEQTLPSLSIATRLKSKSPEKVTIIGGANADDVMGQALAEVAPELDHIFRGEAEETFASFLAAQDRDETCKRLLDGQPNRALDDSPKLDYSDFFDQWSALVDCENIADGLKRADLRLPYETSRGCWWGEKHHCTFCGLNANGMMHRIKSAEKVHDEIFLLSEKYQVNRILMVDNIMPHSYVSSLLPKLATAERKLEIFYEQKANLDRHRMALMSKAGVTAIQPGLESLSTSLLKRMNKGTTLRINLNCLRYARAAGVSLAWNLLSNFPGDRAADYEEMIRIIPLLHHLEPPQGLGKLSIERFSPYHMDPQTYGITDVQPLPAYSEVFPEHNDPRLAYHFAGTYTSAMKSDPALKDRLKDLVDDWVSDWKQNAPLLHLFELDEDQFLLVDTRNTALSVNPRLISATEASLLTNGTKDYCETVSELLDQRQLIQADGRYLAITSASLDAGIWA